MGYIEFDKTQLINLEYSLNKEMIRSNRAGSFSCTTILGCHTRKYHGLMISPQPQLDGGHHILLSKVDETVIQRDAEFNIGVNKFPGSFFPKGHKYVRDFSADLIPVVTYRVGGVVLTKETMFITEEERVMIRYTLVEAHSPTRMRIRPFLAFRNIHRLSKKNIDLDTKYQVVPNGIKVRMYEGYPNLFIQISRKSTEYVHVPDWFNDFEYPDEKERGYEFLEDLYTPGFFEFPIKKGESIIFSASTTEVAPASFSRLFAGELNKRTPRNSFENCLANSAEQFFFKTPVQAGIVAGYPWYGSSGRYSFISLPGLSLRSSIPGFCQEVLASMIQRMDGPLFVEKEVDNKAVFGSADTSLWFFWTLQKCFRDESGASLWKKYGDTITTIMDGYTGGLFPGVSLKENGLIHVDPSAPPLTWMDALVDGKPVTPRHGFVVEVNALWYNALRFGSELARAGREKKLSEQWKTLAIQVQESFQAIFMGPDIPFLADFVYDGTRNISVRPNQVIATSLPYSPLPELVRRNIIDTVYKELLTPRGLRTLSPSDIRYKGRYEGNAVERDAAFHQGTVWPWLLGHFSEGYLKIYGHQGVELIRKLYEGFQGTMKENAIGSISEIYDGNPPHQANGASSFAPSVAEIRRMHHLLEAFYT
ncbi:MAG: amylo-alpha-1,6-glucosidase [Bacteroidales bacterium]